MTREIRVLGCQTCPWARPRGALACVHPLRTPDEGVVIRAVMDGCPLRDGPTTISLVETRPLPLGEATVASAVDPVKALDRLLTSSDRCTRMGEEWTLWALDGQRQRVIGSLTTRQVEALLRARLVTVDGDVLRPGPVAHDLQAQGSRRLAGAVHRALGVRR